MLLSELTQHVYEETGRPDLVDETRNKIVSTTQTLHGREKYFKDILLADVTFANVLFEQTIDLSDEISFPQFRQMAFMRKYPIPGSVSQDPSYPLNMPGLYGWYPGCYLNHDFLKAIDPTDLFDNFDWRKEDVYWQAGTTLNCRSLSGLARVKIGYYSWPVVDPTSDITFKSWIADEYPWAIIYGATYNMFRTIGQLDQATGYINQQGNGLAQQQIQLIDSNQIEVEGR